VFRTHHTAEKEEIPRVVSKQCAMRIDQNYQDLVQKVMMYLDNELSESAERDLLKELRSNPAYMELLDQEQSFRELIKNKLQRRKPSPALVQSIKDKIKIVAPI